jgi:hypothetical protein
MHPSLYERLYQECKRLDLPVTAWVRDAIKAKLDSQEE